MEAATVWMMLIVTPLSFTPCLHGASTTTISSNISLNQINIIDLLVTPMNVNTKQPSTHDGMGVDTPSPPTNTNPPTPGQISNMDPDSDSFQTSSLPLTEPAGIDSEISRKIMNLNKTTSGADRIQTAVPASTKTQDTTISPPTTASTNLTEEHQFSTQPGITISEAFPSVTPVLPSSPASTVKVQNPGSSSLENTQVGSSELDVGDEDAKVPSASPWDTLLAGLISLFIISTALLSTMLFLRFRQQNNQPEFHRLHDLPMDDLLEDTPLSRYAY